MKSSNEIQQLPSSPQFSTFFTSSCSGASSFQNLKNKNKRLSTYDFFLQFFSESCQIKDQPINEQLAMLVMQDLFVKTEKSLFPCGTIFFENAHHVDADFFKNIDEYARGTSKLSGCAWLRPKQGSPGFIKFLLMKQAQQPPNIKCEFFVHFGISSSRCHVCVRPKIILTLEMAQQRSQPWFSSLTVK